MTAPIIYTVGTSTRTKEEFIELLRHYHLTTVVDVRSFPQSRLKAPAQFGAKKDIHIPNNCQVALTAYLSLCGEAEAIIGNLVIGQETPALSHVKCLDFIGKLTYTENSDYCKRGAFMIERYTLPKMGAIWEPQNRYATWLQVEIAVCEAMVEQGMMPQESLDTIKNKANFSVDRIQEIEETVKHDVIAFLTNVEEYVGPDARFIHLGLTSSDILDTALALQLKEAMEIIIGDLQGLLTVLQERAYEHKDTVMIGRSHGIHAEPITFGLKLAVWYSEMKRNLSRLEQGLDVISYGKISGAVGTFANTPPEVEAYACKRLGLKPAPISTQIIQRDRHAQYFTALAILAGSIEKIAVEIRHLQRTEIQEVEESFTPGQKGSSAMPHKKNPVGSENLSGLARLVRSNCLASLENMPLWHERDISHSSVERVIAPDSTILIDYMLNRLTRMMKNLGVNKEVMVQNLEKSRGLIFSQQVLLALIAKGCERQDAYSLVQRVALKAWQAQEGFKELLTADPEIQKYLDKNQVEEIFSLGYHLRHVEEIFARVFQ